MIKKIKGLFVLFILIGIVLCPLKKVNAHSVELDPQSVISLPWIITNGSGTITINNSITNYSLYYQAVQISNTAYSQIEKIELDGKTELDELKTEIEDLNSKYEEAFNKYKEELEKERKSDESRNLKEMQEDEITKEDKQLEEQEDAQGTVESDASEELKKLETAYKDAQTKYNDKVKEYNAKVEEINNKIKELTPGYVENNWIQTRDNKFSVDLTQFSGDQAFAIWIKLVTNDNKTYYDEGTYTMTGTKKAVTQNPSSTDNKKDETKVEDTTIDDTTIVQEILPYTGSVAGYIVILMIILLSIIGIICYKKTKFYNFK